MSRVYIVLLFLAVLAVRASFSQAGDVPKAKSPAKDKAPVIEAAIENGVPVFPAGRTSLVRAGGPDSYTWANRGDGEMTVRFHRTDAAIKPRKGRAKVDPVL